MRRKKLQEYRNWHPPGWASQPLNWKIRWLDQRINSLPNYRWGRNGIPTRINIVSRGSYMGEVALLRGRQQETER